MTLPYLTVQRLLPALRGTLASGLADAGLMRAARRQGMVSAVVTLSDENRASDHAGFATACRQSCDLPTMRDGSAASQTRMICC
jgi:hypothetical protein